MKLLTASALDKVAETVNWVNMARGHLSPETPEGMSPQQILGPVRGILLQDVYGGGSGYADLVYRAPVPYSFEIGIAGENPIADSSFKLRLHGERKDDTVALCTTAAIPAESTAAEMQAAILAACRAASLSVQQENILVGIGNPVSVAGENSYAGCWVVTFNGTLTNKYKAIYAEIVQDGSAFMRGLSTVVTYPTRDVPSGHHEIFHHVINRPADYPWKAGTTCVAQYFLGIGYGIILSNYKDMTAVTQS